MKTVFSGLEVCHIWASQKQREGRSGSIFFDGPSIFSYGRHFEMARFIRPGLVLATTASYSVTTARHMYRMANAVSHCKVFYVPTFDDHNANVDAYIKGIETDLATIARSRRGIDQRLATVRGTIQTMAAYVALFGKHIDRARKAKVRAWEKKNRTLNETGRPGLLPAGLLAKLEARQARYDAAQEVKRKRDQAYWDAVRAHQKEMDDAFVYWADELDRLNIAAWEAGEQMPRALLSFDGPVRLRVVEDEIQTTRGASIPVIEAKKLWHALEAKQEIKGMRLGYYTVDDITETALTVGCHVIPLKEVYRMARRLDLIAA